MLFDFIGNFFGYVFGNKKPKADEMNFFTACHYHDILELMVLSLFEWEGLPGSCDARFLEMTLFKEGRAVFVNDSTLGFLTLRVNPNGHVNHYNEYTSYQAYSNTYTEKSFSANECVFIRNNYLEKPTEIPVMLYASRLAEIQRTIDVNINAQKTPVLIQCDEKDKTTLENIYKQYEGNRPVIVAGKGITADAFKVVKTDAPFVTDKLRIESHELMNEILSYFGINNANTQKKERLITNEVNANDEQVEFMAQSMLITRQEACEKINKMFGLHISVKRREIQKNNEKEDNDNGKLHIGTTNAD